MQFVEADDVMLCTSFGRVLTTFERTISSSVVPVAATSCRESMKADTFERSLDISFVLLV